MAKYLDYEGLKHFVDKIKSLVDGKADKKHSHTCKNIPSPEQDIMNFNAPNLEEYLLEMQMELAGKADQIKLKEKISFIGQIPFKNAQIIEKGGSTSGIPNETMIYELE